MSDFTLTPELLADIQKLSSKGRKSAFALIGKLEYEKCADDCQYWLDHSKHVKLPSCPDGMPYVYTKDPHILFRCKVCQADVYQDKRVYHLENSHQTRIKVTKELLKHFDELPPTRPFTVMEYMPPIIEWWLKSQFMVIEKSRDMMATWLIVTLYTWDALFHNGRQHIFQSEDASKTLELVARAYTIYDNHPKFLKDAIGKVTCSKGGNKSGELIIRDGETASEILGFPQGPDQIRQYHPSGIFTDETAFQAEAGATFSAIKPAIQSGGRYTGVSSANPSYFQLLCEDRSDG